jgi:hypothetical protein
MASGGEVALTHDLLGKTEVGESWLTTLIKQDVLRLDIPVDDPLVVSISDRLDNLLEQTSRFFGGERAIVLNSVMQASTDN